MGMNSTYLTGLLWKLCGKFIKSTYDSAWHIVKAQEGLPIVPVRIIIAVPRVLFAVGQEREILSSNPDSAIC